MKKQELKVKDNGELWLGGMRLHQGDELMVLTPGSDYAVRVKLDVDINDRWYFVGMDEYSVDGCIAERI